MIHLAKRYQGDLPIDSEQQQEQKQFPQSTVTHHHNHQHNHQDKKRQKQKETLKDKQGHVEEENGAEVLTERLTQHDFVTSCSLTKSTKSDGGSISSDGNGCSSSSSNKEEKVMTKLYDGRAPLFPSVMRAHIPPSICYHLETLVQQLLTDSQPEEEKERDSNNNSRSSGSRSSGDTWTPMSHKRDIRAYSRTNGPTGPAFYIKGETILPYTVPEIFAAYFNPANRPAIDSQMASYTRLKWLGRHTGMEQMQFKGQWPTTARDACNMTVSDIVMQYVM
jgi:hypothetical protein